MSNQKPLITVCIAHYRKLLQLKRTINHLYQNTYHPFHLKIYNNGYASEAIKKYLTKIAAKPNVQVIWGKKNIGCAPARGILIQDINTPYILILDDDIYVNQDWDKIPIKKLRQNPSVGAIGFSIYHPDGNFWFTGGQKLSINRGVVSLNRSNIDPRSTLNLFLKVDDVSAGAMLIRKELTKTLDWDPHYFIGFEDLEQGIQLKQSRYQVLVSIHTKFIHDKVSADKNQSSYNQSRRDYHQLRQSYLYFMKKNRVRFEWKRHLFYQYLCLLPNHWLQQFAYLWLKFK